MSVIRKSFGEDCFVVEYLVDEVHHGLRLDQFLQIYLPSFSRQAVKKRIKAGDISIVGRPGIHRPSTKLQYKDIVISKTEPAGHEDEFWNGKKLNLQVHPEVIFDDQDIIAISKPPFMSTHPTGRHLFYCATVYFEQREGGTIHSIHRLDRETSGMLLLAKNSSAAMEMTELFTKKQVKKCYFFIAKKTSAYHQQTAFTEKSRLGTEEKGLRRVYIKAHPENSGEGKSAQTYFQIAHQEGDYVLGLAYPKTGRQHQIRVHAMINGLPLLGDKLYCGSYELFQRFKDKFATEEDHAQMEIPRQALHAFAIKFLYKGQTQTLFAPIAWDLKEWIAQNMSITIEELQEKLQDMIDFR